MSSEWLPPSLGGRIAPTSKEQPLSFDGSPGDSYVLDTQRDRLIEMDYEKAPAVADTPEVFWAPDSRSLIALQTRRVAERTVPVDAAQGFECACAPHRRLDNPRPEKSPENS